MIQYSSMTVGEAIDEILDKVSQFQTATNLDYKTVWMFLNRARREVFARTLPFKDYSYIKRVAISNGDALPVDFTRVVRVLLKSGSNELTAARKAVPKEWWTISNVSRPNLINGASPRFPVYMVWGSTNAPTDDHVHIYTAPSSTTGILEYYAAFADLAVDGNGDPLATATLNVPYEFENLVIQSALLRCYARIAEKNQLAATFQEVQAQYQKLMKNYVAGKATDAINQRALTDPEPSQTPSVSLMQGGQ